MIKNYIAIAWRNLLKNRLFSFINLFSLALSMTVGMMVLIRLVDALSYDRFHPDCDRTWRVISHITSAENAQWKLASTPLPLQESLSQDPRFQGSVVSLYPAINHPVTDGVKDFSAYGAFTQPEFFNVFGFRLLHGDPGTALSEAFQVVITQSVSERFFGDANPVGKVLTFQGLGEFQITGVLANAEGKSHLMFEVYASAATIPVLERERKLPEKLTNWDSFEHSYTYVRLPGNVNSENLSARLQSLGSELNKNSNSGKFAFDLQPLSSITPGWGDIYNDFARASSWGKLITEITISLIILIAACFNYTNLSVARGLTRAREVGIRKIAGARRFQIFVQYIVESIVVALFALFLALAFLSFILEYKPFNDSYEFLPAVSIDFFIMAVFIAYAVVAGILAGVIPAWILSSFQAVKMLRNISAGKVMRGISLRKALLVFQFSISMIVLVFLTTFYRQFSFMHSAETGFRRERVLSIRVNAREAELFKNELIRLAGIENIAAVSDQFGRNPSGAMSVKVRQENSQPLKVNYYCADSGLIPVSGLTLLAGENFSDDPSAREHAIILNRRAVDVLGFQTPTDAVGEMIWIEDTLQVQVVGVIEDFYNEGVGNAIAPLAIRDKRSFRFINLLVSEHRSVEIVTDVEAAWKKIFPDRALSYAWLDNEHDERYANNATLSMLGFLAFMTVTIASLGLLGLVVYTVETRRKEVSIRKIIGASVSQLMALLSLGYVKLLLVACVIALPLGYVLSEFFLLNFANRVSVGFGGLLLVFGFLAFIGLTMIASQTYKASVENPAKNLRSE